MKQKSSRPKLPEASEGMEAWSAALAAQCASWPQVTSYVFLGFTVLYCAERIFALLPRTRAMQTPNSLAFKLGTPHPRLSVERKQDPRIGARQMQKASWFTLSLHVPPMCATFCAGSSRLTRPRQNKKTLGKE